MSNRFFSYSDECGFNTHSTPSEAHEACESEIEHYRDFAAEGWDEGVLNTCWGEIRGTATETNIRDAPKDSPCEYYCSVEIDESDDRVADLEHQLAQNCVDFPDEFDTAGQFVHHLVAENTAITKEAADAKRQLATRDAEIARLREALEPFAAVARTIDDPTKMSISDRGSLSKLDDTLTVADVRAASAALKPNPDPN